MKAVFMRASVPTTRPGHGVPGHTPPLGHITPPRRRWIAGAWVNSTSNEKNKSRSSTGPGGGVLAALDVDRRDWIERAFRSAAARLT